MKQILLRSLAFYLDILLTMIPFGIFVNLLPSEFFYQLYSGIIVLVYFIFCDYFLGRSIGKIVFKLHINGFEKKNKIIFIKQVVIRNLFRFIPFDQISIFFNNDKRMWHDKVSNTEVTE